MHLLARIPSPANARVLVTSLIKSGVDPNVPNNMGDYLLHIAARTGSNKVGHKSAQQT